MKCCLVVYADYTTDTRVIREAEALAAREYSVDVICVRGEVGERSSVRHGVHVLPLRMTRYRGSNRIRFFASYAHFFIRAFLFLSWRHFWRRYEFVQVHNIPDCLVFTALLPKWTGARIILDARDPMPEGFMVKYGVSIRHPITRIILFQELASFRFADEILCVSEQHKRLFVNHGAPESKFTVLMNLPDDKIFGNAVRVREKKSGYELVFHGTLAERLGIDIAIRAIDIVRHEVHDVQFKIYGGGEFLPNLKGLVEELDVGEHVWLSGRFHPARDIPYLIHTADAGIVPNRKNVITDLMMPVKLIEYIVFGIPVIAPRLDTIEYYFGDKVNFFDPGDPHDLASTILEIYYNPDKAEVLAKRALDFLEEYNWKGETVKYYRTIDRMMAEAP